MKSYERTTTETLFIADDGKEFKYQSDCERYESSIVADKLFCFDATIRKNKYKFYKVNSFEELQIIALYSDRTYYTGHQFQQVVKAEYEESFHSGIYAFMYYEDPETLDDIVEVEDKHSLLNKIDDLISNLVDFKDELEVKINSYS